MATKIKIVEFARSNRPEVFCKSEFSEISQNSQEFCFPVNFVKFLRTPLVAASGSHQM